MPKLRLDKLIADSLSASRREIKLLIKSGRVLLDGKPATSGDSKVDPELCEIRLDGRLVSFVKHRYIILNKPAGVITATEDKNQKTVEDSLPPELRRAGLFPVGRLDKDTTGLLILTNDGETAHRIASPRCRVEKLYRAETDKPMGEGDIAAFAKGITLGDGTSLLPAMLEISATEPNTAYITISEGKYHQVKRMCASRGKTVVALKRLSIGGLTLPDTLPEGGCCEISMQELDRVFQKSP